MEFSWQPPPPNLGYMISNLEENLLMFPILTQIFVGFIQILCYKVQYFVQRFTYTTKQEIKIFYI